MGEIASSYNRPPLCGKHLAILSGGGLYINDNLRQWNIQHKPLIKFHSPHTSSYSRLITRQTLNPDTYSCRISTDIPLLESPEACFDKYLDDRSRVFRAMFPDKRRSQRLDEEQWRIRMLPIPFLFLTVCPVVDMRLKCKSKGENYPPQVPRHVSKVLQLELSRWKLEGLDSVVEPSHFSLKVNGALYADRCKGPHCRLKGILEMKMCVVLPHVLALIPDDARRNVAESMLRGLVENMKANVNRNLVADYGKFKREEKLKSLV